MLQLEARLIGLTALAAISLALQACSCGGSPTLQDAGNGTGAAPTGTTGGGSPSSGGSSGGGIGGSTGTGGLGTGACLTGCGNGSGPTSSGSTGTSGGRGTSGGGSTGGGCVGAGGNCALANCCTGLSCDLGTDLCVAQTADGGDAGPTCGFKGDGGSCVSFADCSPPLGCTAVFGSPVPNAGICAPPGAAPSLKCSGSGRACGPGLPPCCGTCVAGVCATRSACGVVGGSCASGADCCTGLTCALADAGSPGDGGDGGIDAGGSSGLCERACGGELGPCQSNSDCCNEQGLFCLPTTAGVGSFCYPELPTQPFDTSGNLVPCAGPCSTFECQLGASCQVTINSLSGALVDPCGPAGLVCDATSSVCRAPGEYDTCKPGGAACQPINDSTANDLQCVQVTLLTGAPFVCVQPCSATSDCVDPLMTCQQDGTQGGFCFYSICQSYFASCPSSGPSDGLCIPFLNGASTLGLCEQAAFSGGETGSACLSGGNRQVGGLCDVSDFCVEGLCSAVCNAGTIGAPSCAGPDAGPADGGAACVPILGQTGDPDNLGTCSLPCDFTSDAGGGCVATDGGAPEKCLPQFLFGLADLPQGLCVLAPVNGIPVAQPCNATGAADACVAGALCLFDGFAGTACARLCDLPGATPGGCSSGQSCLAFVNGGVQSFSTGYCATVLPDGGQQF